MILAMGICYGGIAQVIAGIMEWQKGNTFATTAFTLRLNRAASSFSVHCCVNLPSTLHTCHSGAGSTPGQQASLHCLHNGRRPRTDSVPSNVIRRFLPPNMAFPKGSHENRRATALPNR